MSLPLRDRLRELGGRVSPAGRRWRRFLAELPLDPDRLDQPLDSPGPRDVILCGSPRTGTTLLCGMLWQPPQVVTVMEPWDGMRLPAAELFASLREELRGTGRLSRTRLDIPRLQRDGVVAWVPEGDGALDVAVRDDTVLAVKWPAYWRYLDLLPDTRFIVTLRHPAGVVESYRTASRRLAQGLEYDTAFNRSMNDVLAARTRDPALRRIAMYDHIHSAILPHLGRPEVLAVRYERWFSDPDAQRAEIAEFLDVELQEGPVRLRPPASRDPGAKVLALLRRHCRTAADLGYEL